MKDTAPYVAERGMNTRTGRIRWGVRRVRDNFWIFPTWSGRKQAQAIARDLCENGKEARDGLNKEDE